MKGIFHAKMGTIKDSNGMDLMEAEAIKKRWHSHQNSVVLAQRQKYTSMKQNTKPRDNPIDTLSLTKEARIYNGEKTISLISGAGKTGQPLINKTRTLSNTTHKKKLKMD